MEMTFTDILELKYNNQDIPKNPIVIYGAGTYGRIMTQYFKSNNVEVIAICDSSKEKIGLDFEGFKIQSLEEIKKLEIDFKFIIAVNDKYYNEVKDYILIHFEESKVYEPKQLSNTSHKAYRDMIRDNEKELYDFYNNLEDQKSKEVFINILKGNVSNDRSYFEKAYSHGQYFNELTLSEKEACFIDAGAFNGDTLDIFIDRYGDSFGKVYCFEPFKECFKDLGKTREKYKKLMDKIELINKGLFSKDASLAFTEDGILAGTSFAEDSTSESKCEVMKLDSLLLDNVSFIKMDIEGSELEALKGARDTILRSKPKLAICVYHKPDDILEIPKFIDSLNLNYKYYLRHHQKDMFFYANETVLYAL